MVDRDALLAAAAGAVDAAEAAAEAAAKGGDVLAAAEAAEAAAEALRAILAVETDPDLLDVVAVDIDRLTAEAAAWRLKQ
ncbi:MAG: hypothetical protein OXH69_06765 [Acidobacteria bacterium]|nr:hypothetical protein [Acidobacteriota bacterium]